MEEIVKIKLDKTDSKVIHSNDTYDVIDNTNLDKLIVSKTILHVGKQTGVIIIVDKKRYISLQKVKVKWL